MAHTDQQLDTHLRMGGDSGSSGGEGDSPPSAADASTPATTHVYGHGCTITEEVGPFPEAPAKRARRADPAAAEADAEAKAEPRKLSLRRAGHLLVGSAPFPGGDRPQGRTCVSVCHRFAVADGGSTLTSHAAGRAVRLSSTAIAEPCMGPELFPVISQRAFHEVNWTGEGMLFDFHGSS